MFTHKKTIIALLEEDITGNGIYDQNNDDIIDEPEDILEEHTQ